MTRVLLWSALVSAAWGQEASSGLELRATVSGAGYYSHALPDGPVDGGFRTMLYPVWKLNQHWSVEGAVQLHSETYFREEFPDGEHGIKTDVLQARINYSRYWNRGSLVVRAGTLSSAFGSFLLRYDDASNPLIGMPQSYGYYYKGVTYLGLTGAQVDATLGKFDFRGQFVNSSPANRRSVLDSDQYGNWAGGMGYTFLQGFRVGMSAYRGPYLDRHYRFYFPGEAKPKDLPASAFGIDVSWGRGPWNVYGEWQRFQMDYKAIPTFREHAGYGEVRRVLHPRWYAAARVGYLRASAFPGSQVYEMAAGYRPNAHQLVKVGYEIQQGRAIRGTLANTVAIQLVTTFRPISVGRD